MWKKNIHDDNAMTTSKVSNDAVTSQLLKAAKYFRQGRIGESNDILNNLGGVIETRSQRGRFHALVRGINTQRNRINQKRNMWSSRFPIFQIENDAATIHVSKYRELKKNLHRANKKNKILAEFISDKKSKDVDLQQQFDHIKNRNLNETIISLVKTPTGSGFTSKTNATNYEFNFDNIESFFQFIIDNNKYALQFRDFPDHTDLMNNFKNQVKVPRSLLGMTNYFFDTILSYTGQKQSSAGKWNDYIQTEIEIYNIYTTDQLKKANINILPTLPSVFKVNDTDAPEFGTLKVDNNSLSYISDGKEYTYKTTFK